MRNQPIVFVLLLLVFSATARAQTTVPDTTSRDSAAGHREATDHRETFRSSLFAMSIGIPGVGSERANAEAFIVGLQFTQCRPGRLGADLAVGTMPYAIVNGVGVVGLRTGVSLPVALARNSFLLPSVGLSMIAAMGEGGGGGTVGANVGISLVSLFDGTSGVRGGVTWHHFPTADRAIWLAELGYAYFPN